MAENKTVQGLDAASSAATTDLVVVDKAGVGTVKMTIANFKAALVATFLNLTDSPANYSGDALKLVRVNAGETAVEFVAAESFRGALAALEADLTTIDATSGYAIPYIAEQYDTDAIHDNSTNNTRLTVPAGVTKVRLSASVFVNILTADKFVYQSISKNALGAVYPGSATLLIQTAATADERMGLHTAVLAVTGGDYFEHNITIDTDNSVSLLSDYTWFAMEVIE